MAEIQEDFSVLSYRAIGRNIASRETALTMAEMIFKEFYGEDNFKTQLPLKLTDGGDRWIIEGSRDGYDYPVRDGELHFGRAKIDILKANCQVLKLAIMAY